MLCKQSVKLSMHTKPLSIDVTLHADDMWACTDFNAQPLDTHASFPTIPSDRVCVAAGLVNPKVCVSLLDASVVVTDASTRTRLQFILPRTVFECLRMQAANATSNALQAWRPMILTHPRRPRIGVKRKRPTRERLSGRVGSPTSYFEVSNNKNLSRTVHRVSPLTPPTLPPLHPPSPPRKRHVQFQTQSTRLASAS